MKDVPREIASNCLSLREGRTGIDLVADDVDAELNKEVKLIDQAKEALAKKSGEIVEAVRFV